MNDRTMGVSDPLDVTRRYFLGRGAAVGVGAMALSSLLGKHAGYSEAGASDNVPHFAPKAKRVIFLTQSGGHRSWSFMTISRDWLIWPAKNSPTAFEMVSGCPI